MPDFIDKWLVSLADTTASFSKLVPGGVFENSNSRTILEKRRSLILRNRGRTGKGSLVLGYYLRHPQEVNEYLAEGRCLAEEHQRQAETRFSPFGIRERLLARRAERQI